jgi:hypothetical protein
MRRKINGWQDYISTDIDISTEINADINIPKIQLNSHWVEQICSYRTFPHYSAKQLEQVHKTHREDGWNSSNHNHNYLPQAVAFQHCIQCFEIDELNLHALAHSQESSAAGCKVLPSSAYLARTLRS